MYYIMFSCPIGMRVLMLSNLLPEVNVKAVHDGDRWGLSVSSGQVALLCNFLD